MFATDRICGLAKNKTCLGKTPRTRDSGHQAPRQGEIRAPWATRASSAISVIKVIWVLKAIRVIRVIRAIKATRVIRVIRGDQSN